MKTLQGICFAFICLSLVGCRSPKETPPPPQAVAGVSDLRSWDFEKDGPLNLTGEWAFYWGQLLQPGQIRTESPAYMDIPESWTQVELNGEKLPPEGVATYALTVILPPAPRVYSLHLKGQGTAYRLWVDGVLLAENGQVAATPQDMVPENRPQTVFFRPEGETVEFVIQVSNFHHRKAGFRNEIHLGTPEEIQTFQFDQWALDTLSVGIFFIMGLYHLFIFAFRPKDKAPLYFMIWCFLTAFRAGVTNQNVLLSFFPISWAVSLRLEYLTFFFASPVYALFIQSLYPQEVHRWFVRITVGLGIAFSVGMLFISTLTLSYTSTIYQGMILVQIVYYLYFLWRILSRGRAGAVYIGFASLVGFTGVVLEILYLQNLLPFGKGAPTYGFIGFIFFQAILLSSRFSKSFRRVETLSTELETTNLHLRESERKYRTIFEDSKDLIFIAGMDERVEEVNPASEEILGYAQEEMVTKKVLDLVVNPEDKTEVEKMVFGEGAVKDYELELHRKDGQTVDVLVSVTLRRDETGNVTGVQGIVHDISARKQAEVERLRALKFEKMAFVDSLTQTYNRRFFDKFAEIEVERAKRSGTPLSIILFDIDYFKQVNDTYGHLTGDEVLAKTASLCAENLRSMDIFARYGGEEFVILMPDTRQDFACATGERLRALVAEKPITNAGEKDISITISLGVVNWCNDSPLELQTLLDRADKALYRSKQAGRNRVTAWTEPQK